MKNGPFLGTTWKVKVKDFHVKLHEYFVDHLGPLYSLQLAPPGGYVKRSPQLLVFAVRLCTGHHKTLSDRAVFSLIFVEDVHDKVEGCVPILIDHVHLGIPLDEKVDHLEVRADNSQQKGATENPPADVNISARIDEELGYLEMLISQCNTEGCALVLIQDV